MSYPRALPCALLACVLAGCTKSGRLPDEQVAAILNQPAKEVIGDFQLHVFDGQGVAVRPTALPVAQEVVVQGTFRTIGKAAESRFKPSIITVSLVRQDRPGVFVTHSNCNCAVSGSDGQFEFQGTMSGVRRAGDYIMRARYKGELVVELPVAVKP